jgi:hypothetical protein
MVEMRLVLPSCMVMQTLFLGTMAAASCWYCYLWKQELHMRRSEARVRIAFGVLKMAGRIATTGMGVWNARHAPPGPVRWQ